jgi:hypothetical protein
MTATTLAELVGKNNVQLRYLAFLNPYDISQGAVEPFFFSGEGFISSPTDTPPNTLFLPRLIEPISFTRSMFDQGRVGGKTSIGFGNLVLSNGDGELDQFADYAWDSRPVEIRVGEAGADLDFYFTIFTGESKTIEFDDDVVTVVLRDRQDDFTVDFPPNVYGGAGVSDNIAGQPKPLCFGEVYNISPVLVDSDNLVYQVHDGQIQSVDAVYEGGVELTLNTDYSVNTTTGEITLTSDPENPITADVKGAAPGGSYIQTVASIIQEIVTTYGGLSDPADLNTQSFADLDSANSSTVGVFVPDSTDILDVLDELINTVGGFYGFGRDGKFFVGVLDLPTGAGLTVDSNFDQTNIIELIRLASAVPNYRFRVQYEKNYTQLSEGDFGPGISRSRRDYLLRKGKYEVVEDASIQTPYPNSKELVVDGLFAESADALAEANRLSAIYNEQREVYRIRVKTQPYTLELNDIVEITFDRYNLTSGKSFRVISVTEDAATNEVELELWG